MPPPAAVPQASPSTKTSDQRVETNDLEQVGFCVFINTCAWLTAPTLCTLAQLLYFFALQYTYILSKHSSDPSKAGKLLPMSEDAKKQVQPAVCAAVQGLTFVSSAAAGAPGSGGISLRQERRQGRQAGG